METLLLIGFVAAFLLSATQFFRTKGIFWLIVALASISSVVALFVSVVVSEPTGVYSSGAEPLLGPGFFIGLIALSALVVVSGILYLGYAAISAGRKNTQEA